MRVYKYNYYSIQLPIIWLCVKWFSAKVHLKSNIALVKKLKLPQCLHVKDSIGYNHMLSPSPIKPLTNQIQSILMCHSLTFCHCSVKSWVILCHWTSKSLNIINITLVIKMSASWDWKNFWNILTNRKFGREKLLRDLYSFADI